MIFAVTPDQVTGMKKYTEIMNGRAAMVGELQVETHLEVPDSSA
jgi:hypothetical protein